jgi:Fe-S-cluster containining protein
MGTLIGIPRFASTITSDAYAPFLERLAIIFKKMDNAYQEAANYYGFSCTGCEDSCCYTRFYHHTLLEYFYLLKGYDRLDRHQRLEIERRAVDVCRQSDAADKKGVPVRLLCPLNEKGLCLTYAARPMICRLHGIPHELYGPDGLVMAGRGCTTFYRQCGATAPFVFDRTPFYLNMADLETELRQALDIPVKIKMTIAQMIVSYPERKS